MVSSSSASVRTILSCLCRSTSCQPGTVLQQPRAWWPSVGRRQHSSAAAGAVEPAVSQQQQLQHPAGHSQLSGPACFSTAQAQPESLQQQAPEAPLSPGGSSSSSSSSSSSHKAARSRADGSNPADSSRSGSRRKGGRSGAGGLPSTQLDSPVPSQAAQGGGGTTQQPSDRSSSSSTTTSATSTARSSSSSSSSSGGGGGTDSDRNSNSSGNSGVIRRPRHTRRVVSSLSNMLAAAAERLEASPDALPSPLTALRDTAGLQPHRSYLLPAFHADDQQQRMLAQATAVIERLRSRGYSAFIAGGWVRDVYLQRRAADIDIATSAPPFRVRGIFQGDHMVLLPRSTVKLTHQGQVFELSFFKGISRTSSLFSVGMDAGCRDFTINALYYDPATNQVLDFVGGVADAQARTLRLTQDEPKRLTEDPMRVLRGVRFATVLKLKLDPGTALALKQHAHMCSLNAGVPPRRIWLELRKLAKAEQQQPGSWPHALKLSYHLGLLPHLFPWLQQQQQGSGSRREGTGQHSAAVDPFGYTIDSNSAMGGGGGSSSSSSSGNSASSSAGKAVLVAERLSKLLQQQQQQQGSAGSGKQGDSIPLPLLVAATVHPSADSFALAEPYLRQLFPDPSEWASIQALMTATGLLRGTAASSSSRDGVAAAEAAGWSEFYAHPHAGLMLMVLSCWMPEALAAGFLRTHRARMAAAPGARQ